MNGKDVVSTVNNDQETTNKYNYNAYGEDTDLNNGGNVNPVRNSFDINSNPYKYSGYYLDEESGMYYLQARYYSPELMRFISRDTYDLSNRYAYGDGDPISNVDPNGHMSQWVNLMLGVIGLAMSCVGVGLAIKPIIIAIGNADKIIATLVGLSQLTNVAGGALGIAALTEQDESTKEKLVEASIALGIASLAVGIVSFKKIRPRGGTHQNPIRMEENRIHENIWMEPRMEEQMIIRAAPQEVPLDVFLNDMNEWLNEPIEEQLIEIRPMWNDIYLDHQENNPLAQLLQQLREDEAVMIEERQANQQRLLHQQQILHQQQANPRRNKKRIHKQFYNVILRFNP